MEVEETTGSFIQRHKRVSLILVLFIIIIIIINVEGHRMTVMSSFQKLSHMLSLTDIS